jgi:TetR/AcrR family transcriptional regulator, mexJK operon transcriptional repressor
MSTDAQPTEAAGGTRSARKRAAILDAATTLFLRHGYLGTSMDEVAARAGVSKQTVYKHFADKESLFSEIVTTTVGEVSDPNYRDVVTLRESGDVDADLRDLARRQLERVMQPKLLALRRLAIGEAGRFPELGRLFHEQGPGRTIRALADVFERLAERGVLRLDDPALAAAPFNWLVMSIPLNEAMFSTSHEGALAAADLDRYADAGVDVFLAAYGRRPRPTM